jgi:predicted nuclease of predicted toxin-antitoxin system
VKLLYDENLSRRLLHLLGDLYPGSEHAVSAGLESEDDRTVWAYASEHDLTIVSKDWDFLELSTVRGHPPKVVWLRLGNCSVQQVANVLRDRHLDLLRFQQDATAALLVLGHSD